MPLQVVITEWSLQSYLDLVAKHVITKDDYRRILRPDVLLLRKYPSDPTFQNSTFWGPSTIRGGENVEHGFKMKWHNIGPGKVQLRLCVIIKNGTAFLCQAYVKDNTAKDKREAAKLLERVDLIEQGRYDYRGKL